MTHAAFAMHTSHINAPAQPIADGEAEGLAELQRALAPDESLLDVLQRASREQVHTGFALLDRALSLRPGRVLELAGPAGCGKSELLLQVCVRCLLFGRGPHSQGQGGYQGGHVVLLDLDAKFDMIRMIKVLTAQLAKLGPPPQGAPGPLGDPRIYECLSRFNLITCHSSFDTLAGLLSALRLLSRPECLHQPKLLLIDNVSAFYYQDRAASAFAGAAFPTAAASPAPRGEAWAQAPPVTTVAAAAAAPWQQQPQEQHSPLQQLPQHLQHQAPSPGQAGAMGPPLSPSRSPGPPAAPPLSLQRVHAAMAALVRLVCREARCGCVCTKYSSVWSGQAGAGTDGGGGGGGGGGGRRFTSREVMSTPWQALVTHRLLLLASSKPQIRFGLAATHIQAQWQQGAPVGCGAAQDITSLYIAEGDMVET